MSRERTLWRINSETFVCQLTSLGRFHGILPGGERDGTELHGTRCAWEAQTERIIRYSVSLTKPHKLSVNWISLKIAMLGVSSRVGEAQSAVAGIINDSNSSAVNLRDHLAAVSGHLVCLS